MTTPPADEKALIEPQGRREKRKVDELMKKFRGWECSGQSTNPTDIEIEAAVERTRAGESQRLPFNSPQFHAEIARLQFKDFQSAYSWGMRYHADRIAYFVVNERENCPIEIMANEDMREGQHRLRAAKFMKKEEVAVLVVQE